MTYIHKTVLPAVEEVSMEAVSRCIIEGVVELVTRLKDTAGFEQSLDEDGGKSFIVSVRTRSCHPAPGGIHC